MSALGRGPPTAGETVHRVEPPPCLDVLHGEFLRWAMTRAGLGFWYGAFVNGRLVADLGVFSDGEGLLRYQGVRQGSDTVGEVRR
ncbi:hypothetical protein [Deinococcus metallilatus]|uniref:GNAT family N-acetyltransferase n=1 Tax=Deinococcus metallilatus TaxID=1211322 RepID=A0ABR6MYA5_9DEIO|nr:hypothetical protein [Deinococcus metallilatus]MBB5296926.1 hypothetical protein [Deinococcus metallilatus]